MTILSAVTNAAGPGTVDLQIEQGSPLALTLTLTKDGAPWDVSAVVFDAAMSSMWNPAGVPLQFTVSKPAVAGNNAVMIALTAAQTKALVPPVSTPSIPGPAGAAAKIQLGGWIITADGLRLLEGAVYLDRDPRV